MAVEAAEFASAESVVGGLRVRVVGDDAVVASLGGLVRSNDRTNILAASARRHTCGHLSLQFGQALLSRTHIILVLVILFSLGVAPAGQLDEPLTLLSSRWLVYARKKQPISHSIIPSNHAKRAMRVRGKGVSPYH